MRTFLAIGSALLLVAATASAQDIPAHPAPVPGSHHYVHPIDHFPGAQGHHMSAAVPPPIPQPPPPPQMARAPMMMPAPAAVGADEMPEVPFDWQSAADLLRQQRDQTTTVAQDKTVALAVRMQQLRQAVTADEAHQTTWAEWYTARDKARDKEWTDYFAAYTGAENK